MEGLARSAEPSVRSTERKDRSEEREDRSAERIDRSEEREARSEERKSMSRRELYGPVSSVTCNSVVENGERVAAVRKPCWEPWATSSGKVASTRKKS